MSAGSGRSGSTSDRSSSTSDRLGSTGFAEKRFRRAVFFQAPLEAVCDELLVWVRISFRSSAWSEVKVGAGSSPGAGATIFTCTRTVDDANPRRRWPHALDEWPKVYFLLLGATL